jgi:hypothetical protein
MDHLQQWTLGRVATQASNYARNRTKLYQCVLSIPRSASTLTMSKSIALSRGKVHGAPVGPGAREAPELSLYVVQIVHSGLKN